MSVSVTIGRKLASFPMRRTEGRTYKLVKYGYGDAAIFYQNQEYLCGTYFNVFILIQTSITIARQMTIKKPLEKLD